MIAAMVVLIAVIQLVFGCCLLYAILKQHNRIGLVKKRYAITLKSGEGEFVGLLAEKRWGGLTFDQVVVPPTKASEAPEEVPGLLHVERRNIAYLQELPGDHS